jgi:Arc/MetJ-type ribon-helix-helix transcriptional regulator
MAARTVGRAPESGTLIPRQFMISPEQDEWLREKEFRDKRASKSEIVREALDRAMKEDRKRK